jgi:hypothetical protein
MKRIQETYKICLFGCLLLLSACSPEGQFEVDIDVQSEDKVYSDVTLTRRVLYDLYGRMREVTPNNNNGFSRLMNMNTTVAMLDNATDDGAGNTTRPGGLVPGIQRYVQGAINASTNPVDNTHPWTFYYKAIKNANIFIARVDGSPLGEAEKIGSKHQARFLRAYFYHELFRWFGALVISTERIDPFVFETTRRESLETTVRFIVDEFDALSQPGVLPDRQDGADYGRATRGMAMAYKARTLLYAASDLHRASGVAWREAAQAAADLIGENLYSLYYDTDDRSKSYARLFNTRRNDEIILSYLTDNSDVMIRTMPPFNPWNVNKEITTCPTQWLIDAYDMIDGQEPVVGYNGIEPIVNTASGYDEQNPYANRDPRLNQIILHHGSSWPLVNGSPATLDITQPNNNGSGYFLLKWLDDRVDYRLGGLSAQNFIMMRYAEVLLNYAEAVNEADNTPAARTAAVGALNQIRERAGITGLLDANDFTQETLRQRIRKERRIELCFEEHRFFDIRRWQIAESVMQLPATGIIRQNNRYVRRILDSRAYNPRMNLLPLPMNEVNNCPLIDQNPGY